MLGEHRGMPDRVVHVQPDESVVGAELRERPALAMISSMFRKIALGIGLVVLAAVAAYQVLGLRVSVDGSGMIPRFLSSAPDYDALEADRTRQRALLLSADLPQAPPAAVERGAAEGVTDALSSLVEATVVETPSEPSPPEASAVLPTDGYWPDFRGPRRDGRYDEGPVLTNWPEDGLRQLWKQPIGRGYASFVVADGRAFTIEQRRDHEVVSAYEVESGRELWTVSWPGEFVETMGGDGPRATPTYHEGRVYALGALGELRCLDAVTGHMVWRRNILSDAHASNLSWGMAGSPLIVDDQVIVLPGGRGGRSVAAYDKRTGEPVWTALDDRQAYTSPALVTLGGVRQLLVVSATRAIGLVPEDGRLLWAYPWRNNQGINVAQPLLLGNDRVFLSASYGAGAAVFEVQRVGEMFTTTTLWQNQRMKNKFTSSVLHEGFIYGLDEGILACLDASTGNPMWKGGRYGYGQLMLAGDRLIVITEDGDLVQVRATPDGHDEIARFPALDGKTWNHPVVVDGRLLVRNLREMAAFDIRP